jgi:deazaflavin-dependent oxidoreductase (nitroreductase family)
VPDTDSASAADAADEAALRALRARLARIAAFEDSTRANPLTALTRRLSRTSWFAAAYRRVGPRVDPTLRKVADGRLMASLYGFRFLTLHSTGAKSGQPRESPLLYIRDGDDVLLLGTNFGQPKHPAWTANLIAHPRAAVDIGPERLDVEARLVDDDAEWQALFPRFVEVYPGYEGYLERRGGLPPRMFRLVPRA